MIHQAARKGFGSAIKVQASLVMVEQRQLVEDRYQSEADGVGWSLGGHLGWPSCAGRDRCQNPAEATRSSSTRGRGEPPIHAVDVSVRPRCDAYQFVARSAA